MAPPTKVAPRSPAAFLAEALPQQREAFARMLADLSPWLAGLDADRMRGIGQALAELAARPPVSAGDVRERVARHVDPEFLRDWMRQTVR